MDDIVTQLTFDLTSLFSCFPGPAAYPQCTARGFCVSQTGQRNHCCCLFTSHSTSQQHCREVGAFPPSVWSDLTLYLSYIAAVIRGMQIFIEKGAGWGRFCRIKCDLLLQGSAALSCSVNYSYAHVIIPLSVSFPGLVLVDLVHCLAEIMSGSGDLPGEYFSQEKSLHFRWLGLYHTLQNTLMFWAALCS